jgi:hypothetical protein
MATSPAQNGAPTEELELTALVELGRNLLDRLVTLDSSNPQRAWEPIIELEGLVDRLRELRPPPALRSKNGS